MGRKLIIQEERVYNKTVEKKKSKTEAAPLKAVLHVTGLIAAALLFELFLCLSLGFFIHKWARGWYLAAVIGGSIVNAGVLATDLVCFFLHRDTVSRFCITAYAVGVFFAVGFYVLLRTGLYELMRSEGGIKELLHRSGNRVLAVFIFILLQFLQVVILPIPSTVTVAAGALVFGPLWGSIFSLIGIVLGSLVAFLIGRYAGFRVVAWLIGKDTLEKWLKKIKGKDKLLLSAMFLLPVFPDDVLCFVAGLSSMSVWLFLAVILLSRVLAIFTTSYSITLIPFKGWGLAVWAVIGVLIVALFVLLYKKSDAILGWIERHFHRETRIKEKEKKGEFTMHVIGPDGAIVEKGVKRGEDGEKEERG